MNAKLRSFRFATLFLALTAFCSTRPLAGQAMARVGAAVAVPAAPDSTAASGLWPSSPTWKRAATHAITDAGTWLPALAALVIVAGDWDAKIGNWAVMNTPIFGSPAGAASRSDDYRTATQALMLGSALLAQDNGRPVFDRFERIAWQGLGAGVTFAATRGGKAVFHRLRPDESDRSSLPSGHSAQSFYATRTAMQNFDDIEMSSGMNLGLDILSGSMAAASAWSRVEAALHYPTDILVGAALGNALSVFFFELYKGDASAPRVAIQPGAGSLEVSVQIRVR